MWSSRSNQNAGVASLLFLKHLRWSSKLQTLGFRESIPGASETVAAQLIEPILPLTQLGLCEGANPPVIERSASPYLDRYPYPLRIIRHWNWHAPQSWVFVG